MSSPTPGPWGWYSAILKGRVKAEQLLIQPATGHEHPDDFSDIIAELPWQHFNVTEREANARLIAAAPALLEAAEALMDAIEKQLSMTGKGITPSPRVAAALSETRAAIRQARGEK